ncbi:MAG: redox-regulated ATPase YchF [Candidatus Micrarchaeota archaeon]
MAVSLGIVGKPNTGKSTFFSALTMADVKIAPYPFTTIEPNKAIAYIRKQCPHTILRKKCEPRDSSCIDGTRFVPIQIIDVAGLVPEAHLGKGLGLQFLDDIRQVDALIQVIDASGKSDLEGKTTENCDPAKEVEFLEKEIMYWISGILERNWNKVKGKPISAIYDIFNSMKVSNAQVEAIVGKLELHKILDWDEEQKLSFAKEITKTKPIFIAANKADLACIETMNILKEKFAPRIAFCSSMYELALRKAAKSGVIEYIPGSSEFKIINANDEQHRALEKIVVYLKENGNTGVQNVLEKAVNEMLGMIAVYPVEDEHKWSDKKGTILPNVFLLQKNSTPLDLATKVHTELAKNFISSVDAKRNMHIGKDHILKDGDVIKIISG